MITEDKIKIFKRYHGDIDSWARSGSKKEQLIMTDDDWYMIESLVQDLVLSKNGLTSAEFDNNLNTKLKETCTNEEAIYQLKKLTDKK